MKIIFKNRELDLNKTYDILEFFKNNNDDKTEICEHFIASKNPIYQHLLAVYGTTEQKISLLKNIDKIDSTALYVLANEYDKEIYTLLSKYTKYPVVLYNMGRTIPEKDISTIIHSPSAALSIFTRTDIDKNVIKEYTRHDMVLKSCYNIAT